MGVPSVVTVVRSAGGSGLLRARGGPDIVQAAEFVLCIAADNCDSDRSAESL